MRIVVAALWLILFLVLFAFAVNNTFATDLHFFAGMTIKAPLIALLLAFFIGGFVFGFIALAPSWVRQRVEIRRLRRAVPVRAADAVAASARSGGASAPALVTTEVMQNVARSARETS
jgi:putative membrane protein